jgi:hypothetical protein
LELGHGLFGEVAALGHGPFVVGFDHDGVTSRAIEASLGKMPTTLVRRYVSEESMATIGRRAATITPGTSTSTPGAPRHGPACSGREVDRNAAVGRIESKGLTQVGARCFQLVEPCLELRCVVRFEPMVAESQGRPDLIERGLQLGIALGESRRNIDGRKVISELLDRGDHVLGCFVTGICVSRHHLAGTHRVSEVVHLIRWRRGMPHGDV